MLGCLIVLSTMNASKTNIFPDTVSMMQDTSTIVIIMVCHNSNGGRTGVSLLSVEETLLIMEAEALAYEYRYSDMFSSWL